MKDSYLTAGIRFRPLLSLLLRNQISFSPSHILRILFLLQSSVWSSLFSRLELLKFRHALEKHPIPRDPIFIVGHWRTGSTLLHQLMALDSELAAPTLFQVALPENFMISYRFYQPIFKMMMGSSRPMDNVKIGMDEPQEDEYAIFRLTTQSPLEQLIFPPKKKYYLLDSQFVPEGKSLDHWAASLKTFYKKIHFVTGRRVLSKNPFNSMRIPLLAELFPEARFIHIVRHPYSVVPSTRHLWDIVQRQNILNRNRYLPTIEEVSAFYSQLSETVIRDLSLMPDDRFAEVRYEDLETNPAASLQTLYRKINLPFSNHLENQLNEFTVLNTGYQKNTFSLSAEEKKTIANTMINHMDRYGYMEKV
ncbi:MAG: sulfotransferase [Bacteroidales bacterium]|nr:sulfotransferase [Bacteroidales bacterium]